MYVTKPLRNLAMRILVAWDDANGDFGYTDPNGGRALLELAPTPSWHELRFRG